MKSFSNFILVFFLGGAFLLSSTYKTLIRLEYQINKLEIIEKFCINKEETKFECDGKCHLKTKLEEAESPAEKNVPKEVNSEHQLQLYLCAIENIIPSQKPSKKAKQATYSNLYSFLTSTDLDPPPKMI
ncbi:MAG: hypothetical protein RIC95_11345 [Vicingaceae bacterium]